MSALEISLLIAVGLVAGVVNTLAGGGSLLTVPLLVIFGLPGTIANGTNRVGVLVQCAVACWRFDAEGISEFRGALPLLPPIVLGSLVGAAAATQIPDLAFEQIFAGIMLILLIPLSQAWAEPGLGPRIGMHEGDPEAVLKDPETFLKKTGLHAGD